MNAYRMNKIQVPWKGHNFIYKVNIYLTAALASSINLKTPGLGSTCPNDKKPIMSSQLFIGSNQINKQLVQSQTCYCCLQFQIWLFLCTFQSSSPTKPLNSAHKGECRSNISSIIWLYFFYIENAPDSTSISSDIFNDVWLH